MLIEVFIIEVNVADLLCLSAFVVIAHLLFVVWVRGAIGKLACTELLELHHVLSESARLIREHIVDLA
jgi:hypothetical protein